MASSISTVSSQVMWNRMISVVEEQAQALVRTAFSTSVREAGDLSAGVYDTQGQMLAQAVTGTPGHVNAMADAVAHFIRRIGRDNILEGDVYITNDPWEGTGHLHDITVVSPSFLNGKLVGFFGCTAHIVDIGGRGFGADANSVYEEGLYIPIMKFAAEWVVDKTLVNIVRGNVREPDQLIGDIYALATCNEIGHRRLIDMMNEFGLAQLNDIGAFILENSKRATIERIAALPRQSATGSMTIDGYSHPVDLKVRLDIKEDHIVCDFDGTSGLDKKGINVPVIGHMIPDTVFDALDKILPETVPAEGAGCLCNFQVSLRPRTDAPAPESAVRSEVLTFNSGGAGARPSSDGLNATAFPSGVMTMPVEATEHTGPVIIWRKELRPDSGGAGRYRGGLGQYMEVGAMAGHEFDFQAMFDRVEHPARGRQGGANGAPTAIGRSDGEPMKGKGKQFVPHGHKVMLEFPGGAGYGKPGERDRALIKRDLARGYISIESAKRDYAMSDAEVNEVLTAVANGNAI